MNLGKKSRNFANIFTFISKKQDTMDRKVAVLFDLDGVLIDSEGLYTEFWAKIGREFNVPSPTFAADIKGTTLKSILNYFPGDELKATILQRIHDFEDTMEYRLFAGVAEFLTSLKRAGIPTAIVTSSDEVKMSCLYAQLPVVREMVDVVIDASMVTRSKPDPQGYLLAAEKLGIPAEDCYVFEDSIQGLEAGRRAGATVIGLATTNSVEQVEPLCDYLLPSFVGFTVEQLLAIKR